MRFGQFVKDNIFGYVAKLPEKQEVQINQEATLSKFAEVSEVLNNMYATNLKEYMGLSNLKVGKLIRSDSVSSTSMGLDTSRIRKIESTATDFVSIWCISYLITLLKSNIFRVGKLLCQVLVLFQSSDKIRGVFLKIRRVQITFLFPLLCLFLKSLLFFLIFLVIRFDLTNDDLTIISQNNFDDRIVWRKSTFFCHDPIFFILVRRYFLKPGTMTDLEF